MYALYYISHLMLLCCLLAFSATLFFKTAFNINAKINQSGKSAYSTVKWTFIVCFIMLAVIHGKRFVYGTDDYSHLRTSFDKREWMADKKIRKGSIYDRSGLPERAFALSKEENAGDFRRIYPLGSSSGHIIGYSSKKRGRAGLEAVFASELAGLSNGNLMNTPNYIKRRMSSPQLFGNNIMLSLDSRLQRAGYNALNGRKGAVVILVPKTGEVLAMCSSPGFSPEDADSDSTWIELAGRDEDAPFFNRAIQGLFPPGSVFKIITAAAALEKGIQPEYVSGAEGFIPSGSARPVHEHEWEEYSAKGKVWTGHGKMNMEKGFQKSSNVYFAKLSRELGKVNIFENAERFGFNTSIKWNTASGSLQEWFNIKESRFPDPDIMSPEGLAWASIGQNRVLISPMHMALITAAIANGGNLMMPSIELGRFPKKYSRVCSKSTSEKLRKMMRLVVKKGTGYRANVPGLEISGKTGTAENSSDKPHSWFVSFAPYRSPELVIVAVVENGGYGGYTAAKVIRSLMLSAKEYGYFNN